jgi:hypothetical protein
MKRNYQLFVIAVSIIVASSVRLFAESEIKGKDVVTKGAVQTLSGTLKADGGHEWLLVTDQETYELHLGPEAYRESKKFTLTEGQKAEVKGFVLEKNIAPITIKTDKSSITLRDEAGKAVWAGTAFSSKKEK